MKNIQDFSGSQTVKNWTPVVIQALREQADGLFFPSGTYHFYPEGTGNRYLYITNNDEGLKRVVFYAENREDFSIQGENAEFIFHGRLLPFFFSKIRHLHLSGFSVDFAMPFMVEALVEACDDHYITLRFPANQKYRIIDGKICFIDDDYKFLKTSFPWEVFDTTRRERAEGRSSGFVNISPVREIEPHLVVFPNRYSQAKAGEWIVMKPEARLTPGLVLDSCHGVEICDVIFYSAGGMGMVAQNSFDLSLERVKTQVRPGSGRLVSVSDDAVHFANCGGKISLQNCLFENQWDDAVNIHGVYRSYIPQNKDVHYLKAGHYQQFGIPFVKKGEHVLIDGKIHTVKFVEDGKQYAWFDTEEPISEDTPFGTPVLNMDRQPDVLIRDCVFRSNQPRGVLCSSGGHVLIENNQFHTPGPAILAAGDSTFWFEAGPVNDMTIRNNVFDNCFYLGASFPGAVIAFQPSVCAMKGNEYYHRHIRILDNEFRDNHGRLLSASRTDDLVFSGNRWMRDDTYHSQTPGKALSFEQCGKIVAENNLLPEEKEILKTEKR